MFLRQINRSVAVQGAPSTTKVERAFQVRITNGAHSTKGLVNKLSSVHGSDTAEQAELSGGGRGCPSCDPSCNSTVLRSGHVVGCHHVSGIHGEEFSHTEGRAFSVRGDNTGWVVRKMTCNHEADGVHAGHVDTQEVVESVGEVVVVGQIGVRISSVGLETCADGGVHGPVSDEGRVEVRDWCFGGAILVHVSHCHGDVSIGVGSCHHRRV